MTLNAYPPHPLANIGGDSHCIEAGNVLVPAPASRSSIQALAGELHHSAVQGPGTNTIRQMRAWILRRWGLRPARSLKALALIHIKYHKVSDI